MTSYNIQAWQASKPKFVVSINNFGEHPQTIHKLMTFLLLCCFWSSNHSKTYDFVIFMMLLELKPFKHL